MISLLKGLVVRTDVNLSVTTDTISDAVQELQELEGEESEVSRELTTLRRRLAEMTRIRNSAANYNQGLHIQRDRLQVSAWLATQSTDNEGCPVCGSHMEASATKLRQLNQALSAIEQEAGEAFEIPAAFEREMQRVGADVSNAAEHLKAVQVRKDALAQRSKEAESQQYQTRMVERFIGGLENALHLQQRLAEDGELQPEVALLRERVQQLEDELRSRHVEQRTRQALSHVNANAARLLPLLDSERPNDPVSLEINDLSIKVKGAERDDYLSEIGSGSNWLSYHMAMILALQQFFISQRHSPVPGFVEIDQPSQVYFPKKLIVREGEEADEPNFKDEDIVAVRKVFNVLSEVVGAASGRLQVIVLDHAPRDVWGDVVKVVSPEEWREGRKLVPVEWIN